MTTEADESQPIQTYELACNDCQFETTVDGTVLDALDVADSHQTENGDTPTDHFVDFELGKTP
jgi:hypothetical protein